MSDDEYFVEGVKKIRKKMKKKKKSQQLTTMAFWRQLPQNPDNASTNTRPASPKIKSPSVNQSICPDDPGQSIRPGNPGKYPAPTKPGQIIQPGTSGEEIRTNKPSQDILLGKPGQTVRPNNPGHNIRPTNPGQNIHPTNPGQNFSPNNPGQNIRPNNPGQNIRPNNPGQNIRPNNPGQNIRPTNPGQNIHTTNPGQNFSPNNPGQNIRPNNPGQNIRPNNPGQNIRPTNPGQNIHTTNPGQNFSPNNPGQNIRPNNPGQNIRPNNSGQNIRPNISGQNFRPNNPGQNIHLNNPGGNVRPTNPAQVIRQANPSSGNSGQSTRPGNSAQSIQPGKPIPSINSNKPSKPKKTEDQPGSTSNQPINIQGQGLKFKPLQEVGKCIDIFSTDTSPVSLPFKPHGVPDSMLQSTDNPVITIIGKNPQPAKPTVSQQKKILKFQMRMHSLQEKKRQERQTIKMMESINTRNQMETPPHNPNMGMPNPGEMLNFVNMQYPTGVPNPGEMVGIPNMPIMPNPNIMYNSEMPMLGVPLQHPVTNFMGMPNQPDPVPVSMYQNQINPVPVPITPIPQPDIVRTVFHMEPGLPSISQPNPTIQSKPEQSPKTPNTGRFDRVDQFGFKYPKGVPKSFLHQQQNSSQPSAPDAPIWPTYPPTAVQPPTNKATSPLLVLTDGQGDIPQPYSPSELYNDLEQSQTQDYYEDIESPEPTQSGQKRLSAFRRLGPQTQPKKPKMTISVTVNEDQEIREVVDETEELEEITPVHLREDMILSTDETVMKYLKSWPWKRNVVIRKSVTARNSKTVMMLEKEQMEEIYDKETLFVQVTVKGYPSSWTKEDVLDTLMEYIRQYSFIPCFIEFNREECKFLTLRCRSALLSLHKCGFIIRKNEVELIITIAQTELTLNQLDFVPRLVLRKRLIMCAENEHKLDLSAFTLKEDISHFIYFPLNRANNQMEIIQMQNEVSWGYLTDLNLSHNRITSIEGFDLEQTAPKLQHLDLSHNCLDKATLLLKCRNLPLKTIRLEGNPLCTNYTDPDQYVKVLKMMFSGLTDIDGIPVYLKGEMPKYRRNYCPSDAKELVDKFLEIYFPLLEGDIEHRASLQNMYKEDANMTITYNYKLAFGPIYRCFKSLFANARQLEEDKLYMIKGSSAVVKTIASWPHMEHDPFTFTVDVVFHSDTTTIIRVDGMLKLTRESLAEDEHLLSFSRTLVLHTRDYVEYKIQAEMLYWSLPTGAYAKSAFAVTAIKTKQMYPKIDSTTDEELQAELLKIFMSLTTMNKKVSERCLELKKWNIKEALDHFTKLLRLDSLETLIKEVS